MGSRIQWPIVSHSHVACTDACLFPTEGLGSTSFSTSLYLPDSTQVTGKGGKKGNSQHSAGGNSGESGEITSWRGCLCTTEPLIPGSRASVLQPWEARSRSQLGLPQPPSPYPKASLGSRPWVLGQVQRAGAHQRMRVGHAGPARRVTPAVGAADHARAPRRKQEAAPAVGGGGDAPRGLPGRPARGRSSAHARPACDQPHPRAHVPARLSGRTGLLRGRRWWRPSRDAAARVPAARYIAALSRTCCSWSRAGTNGGLVAAPLGCDWTALLSRGRAPEWLPHLPITEGSRAQMDTRPHQYSDGL